MHCLTPILAVIFTLFLTTTAEAQKVRKGADRFGPADTTTIYKAVDTIKLPGGAMKPDTVYRYETDSLTGDTLAIDSTGADTTAGGSIENRLGIRLSPDALESVVTSKATDSAVMDMERNLFYLYGDAQVNYEDLQLNAGEIAYAQESNLVTASPSFDSSGAQLARPSFTQGQEKFTYDSLQYNFKSKRAIVRNARTQYGEGFVHSQQIKRNPDQSIYGLQSVYTTCALDTPHFGIKAKKIKVIPNKVIASGPANINIEEVPTPIFLPFGLFPISQGQRSGFRLPMYTIEERRGVGLQQGGYYFAINEYVDFLVTGDVYSRGSYNVSGVSSYTNRYHYSGGLSLAYAYNKTGEVWEQGAGISKDFKANWEHRSDAKSRPGVNFNASVVFGTATYNNFNSYTVNQILQNQYQSNITYQKSWQNKPYSLTVSARHSQNNQTREVNVLLPEVNFFVAQFNPFEGKSSTGNRWYEKITAQYNFNALNRTDFIDSTFSLRKLSLGDFDNGIHHNIPISASYNVLRFINMTFGANYNEYWLTRKTYHFFNPAEDRLDTNVYKGFFTARDFNASVGANTRIYGLRMFRGGSKLMGIRHVLTPSASLTFTPDYAAAPFRYGYQTLEGGQTPIYRSTFENSLGFAPNGQFGNFSSMLAFGIDNNLQIKVRTKDGKDSVGSKNIRLIDNFSINGGYDLAKDSFRWSLVTMRFATNLFNVLNIQAGAVFDPYDFDYTLGRNINSTLLERGGGVVRFRQANASIGGSLRSVPNDRNRNKPEAQTEEYERLLSYGRYNDYVDFNVPWNLSFSYNATVARNYDKLLQQDTLAFYHTAMFSGDFNLTPRWKFEIQSGYNFTEEQLSVTQLSIYRDLHCWEMRLSTVPFGLNKNFQFQLNVKAQILQDLKLVRRRDFRDAIQ
ncbi:putative LPS assembly protein LptD [Polluticoccus soli]|uniref:putative LPS assembly protein LptD n=1 Tax=Polluticoccus soli TaxID=3034150 RepID=UPI0023E2B0FA|nr:putative LPS assembly protein LptD [Flavipsychrobacter sp. JY13-12]